MAEDERIENLYNAINLYEEVEVEEIKDKVKENIVSIYLVMDQLGFEKSYKMQQRVAEVKEYISELERKLERKNRNGD